MNKFKNDFPHVSLGLNLAVGMAVFTLGGNFLGKKTGSEFWGTVIGAFIGLIYGGYEIWKILRETNK